MDPEGRAVKISSGKRFAACEEWMRNRRDLWKTNHRYGGIYI